MTSPEHRPPPQRPLAPRLQATPCDDAPRVRPGPGGRPARRGVGRLVALLAATALAACGPDDALPDPPAVTRRLAVVSRAADWSLTATEPAPASLTLAWEFDAGADGWSGPGGSDLDARDGALALHGAPQATALSPAGADVQPDLQHWLTLRLRSRNAGQLVVQWRGPGEAFSLERATTPLAVPTSAAADAATLPADWQTLSIPLSSLRGARQASDVAQGVEQFKLAFTAADVGPVDVELDAVALVSDLDAAPGAVHRLASQGLHRDGVVLRAGGRASATLTLDRPGRVRLALAAAASRGPWELAVTCADERRRLRLSPRSGWRELRFERPAGEVTLTVEAPPRDDPRASVLLAGPLVLEPADTPRPPILLYVEDTLRADRLSIHGHGRETDAHLAAIAAEGVVLTSAHAASSWTRPSISTLLTSLDPPSHGNRTHLARVGTSVETLAERLSAAGYLTASFVTNYHGGSWSGLDQGFDQSAEPTWKDASRLTSTLTSAVITDELLAFLEDHADEQVFLHVHTLDPHAPYEPPHQDLAELAPTVLAGQANPRLRYDAEVRHNDRQLGRLDAALAEHGLADDTLLVFTSDHGEAFGEHGHEEHRQSLHVAETWVPWVLRWPAGLPGGARLDAPVGHIDLAPTLAGLAGVQPAAAWMGRDLSAWLTGAGALDERPLLADLLYESPRDGRPGELAVVARDRDGVPLKLLLDLGDDGTTTPRALFDLAADPAELHDLLATPDGVARAEPLQRWGAEALRRGLATSHAETAAGMDEATRAWMAELGYLGGDR